MSQGLDDVIAAETRLSSVDGAHGILVIKGFSLDQIAGQKSFEDVAWLLFGGLFDDLPDAHTFAVQLGQARREMFGLVHYIDDGILALPRLRDGQAPLAPDPRRGHAADMLHMLNGQVAAPETVSALDTYLVTVADHGLNASTFAARVVASTWSGLTSSVLAGLAALKGPLHGGAPGPIIAMLEGIVSTRFVTRAPTR